MSTVECISTESEVVLCCGSWAFACTSPDVKARIPTKLNPKAKTDATKGVRFLRNSERRLSVSSAVILSGWFSCRSGWDIVQNSRIADVPVVIYFFDCVIDVIRVFARFYGLIGGVIDDFAEFLN